MKKWLGVAKITNKFQINKKETEKKHPSRKQNKDGIWADYDAGW